MFLDDSSKFKRDSWISEYATYAYSPNLQSQREKEKPNVFITIKNSQSEVLRGFFVKLPRNSNILLLSIFTCSNISYKTFIN